MTNEYTLFVDESGEAGISKVRSEGQTGASPYMTMGAVLVPMRAMADVTARLKQVEYELGKNGLHCSKLKHYELLHFARTMAKSETRIFGVISKKETLGKYKYAIRENSKKYYNKCAQYLLERVGWFLETRGIAPHQLDIVFERANVDYGGLCNLVRRCQDTPKHPFSEKLRHISADRISSMTKNEHPALWMADLVAHALYKCVDRPEKNFGIPEPRYLNELAGRFFGKPETNEVLGAGLYCVHKIHDLDLDSDVEQLLSAFVANTPA